MILKILRIIKKIIILLFYNLNNQPFQFIIELYKKYKNEGRRSFTKSINISYKVLMMSNNTLFYNSWIKENEVDLRNIDLKTIPYQPFISIVVCTYNTPTNLLKKTIESVVSQTYNHWELCIVDDASDGGDILKVLEEYENRYSNIKVHYRKENGHISVASNTGLSLVEGEYVAFLDHDDELAIHALYEIVKTINRYSDATIIYSDEDKIDSRGKRFEPHFKSDWNEDMFYSQNYISHLSVIKKEIIDKTEKFRIGYEGSQDYDLLLQSLKFIKDDEVYHISKILYHWRAIEGSTALEANEKNYTTKAGLKALSNYFQEKNIFVEQGFLVNTYKVNYKIIGNPKVSIIIPTKDNYALLFTCISSILALTDYENYEIVIIDNQTTDIEALVYLDGLKELPNIQVLTYNKAFNYAIINNYAVSKARGEFILLLNNDIEIINASWLSEMLQHAQRKEIGIVGAKLYYEDRTIQHAGVVLGIGGVAGHAHKYSSQEAYGYFSRLQIIQNYSALTGACMMMKKSIYLEVGGLEEALEVAFNDIDLCLKVLEKGYRNLWTPYAELIHYESKSRGLEDTPEKKERFEKEIFFMKQKWAKELLGDRCYNANLTLVHENFSLKLEEKN